MSLFHIDGYNCFCRGRSASGHGGLITFVDNNYDASIIKIDPQSNIWEGLFLNIENRHLNHKITLGNVYRPPRDNNNRENINTFVVDLEATLSILNDKNCDFIVTGDFNINLLHINLANKEHFSLFLDMMLSYNLFPKITLPTRISHNSCTLIDNTFCKLSSLSSGTNAGIIMSQLSDHFPHFLTVFPGNLWK